MRYNKFSLIKIILAIFIKKQPYQVLIAVVGRSYAQYRPLICKQSIS